MKLSDYNKKEPTNLTEALELIEWLLDRIGQLNEIIVELERE